MKFRLPKTLLIMLGLCLAGSLNAAVLYKDVTTTDINTVGNWSTANNASTPDPLSIGTSDELYFNNMFAPVAGTYTATTSADIAVGCIRLDNGVANANVVIGSAGATNTITLNGAGDTSYPTAGFVLNSSAGGSLTVNNNLLLGANQIWVSSRTLQVNGGLDVNGKTLTFNAASSTNGALRVRITGALSGTGTISKTAGAGTVELLGDGTNYTGSIGVSTGWLVIGLDTAKNASSTSATGGYLIVGTNGTTRIKNINIAAAANLRSDYNANGGSDGARNLIIEQTIDGVIAGNIVDTSRPISITKTGAATLTISSTANSQAGSTTVNEGTLKLGSAVALGSTAAGTTVNNGGVLDLNGQTIGAEALTLNGTGISSGGALVNSSATASSLSGNINLATASSIGGSGNTTLSGVISGAGQLTKSGSGTLTLSGAADNTYSGGTTINAGTVVVNKANALGASSGAVTVNGGTLNLNGMAIGNSIAIGSAGKLIGASNQSLDKVSFASGAALTGSFGAFNSGTDASKAYNVTGGASFAGLSGQGTFNGGVVSVSGTHAVGNSPGTQTFSNGLSYADSSVVNLEISADGLSSDSIVVKNALSFGSNVALNLSIWTPDGYTEGYANAFWSTNKTFTLIDAESVSATKFGTINLDGLGTTTEGSWSTAWVGNQFQATWTANAIPEPSSVGLLGVGLAGMLLRRRRKQA